MTNFVDERRYAWRMMRAALQAQPGGMPVAGAKNCHADIITLLDEALDAGLDRAELIVELASLGARLFALCDVDSPVTSELVVEDSEICLN